MSSKFEYSLFNDGFFAVSKQKYTKEQAIEIFKREMDLESPCVIAIGSAFVRYRYGLMKIMSRVLGGGLRLASADGVVRRGC